MFQTEMLKVIGVKMYELGKEKKTITVYFNPRKTNLQTIRTAISKLGFDADETKADPEAYEKLDGCCKAKKKSSTWKIFFKQYYDFCSLLK